MPEELLHIAYPPSRDFVLGHGERHTTEHHLPRSMCFLFARTDPRPDWDVALAKVKEYMWYYAAAEGHSGEDNLVSELCFIILDSPELQGADDNTIRRVCRKWWKDQGGPKKLRQQDTCFPDTTVCLTMDATDVRANIHASGTDWKGRGCEPTDTDDMAVRLRMLDIDYTGSEDIMTGNRPGYCGWVRVAAMFLSVLCEDLRSRPFEGIVPILDHYNQIPVYDGEISGRLVDSDN